MSKALLLVVDFINDIVNPKFKTASCASYVKDHDVMARANEAIAFARKNNILIAHVKVGFSDDYCECPKHSPIFGKAQEFDAFKLSGTGCDFHKDMDVRAEDKIIIKHRISTFYNTDLEVLMRAQQINHLVICGVSTSMAVELSAREAHDRDYHVTVLEDACGAQSAELHDNALTTIKFIGEVISVREFTNS